MTWENILSDSEFQAQPDDVKMRVAKNYFKENFSADPEFKSLPSDQRMKVSFNFFKTIQKQETNGAWEGFVKPTLKAIPKVTGATVGSMALAPGAGIQGLSAMLPNANEPASFERGAKKFEEIMSFPSESLTPEERQGAENVGLAMKPFEWAGQAGAYVGRKADQGLQNLGLAPTALEPVMGAITEAALMFGLNGIPKTVKNIKSSDWYRTKTIKERAVVDSFVDNMAADIESGNMTVEQMREIMRGTDQAAKDALINKYVRGQETVTPEAPTVTPQATTETAQIPKVTVRNGRRGQVNVKPDENILTRQPDDVPDFDPEREALKAKVAPILQEVLQSKQIEVNPEVINTQNKIAEIEGIIQKNQAYKGAPIYSTWETALAENRQKLDDMINGRQPKEQSTVQTPEPQKAEDIQLPEIVEPTANMEGKQPILENFTTPDVINKGYRDISKKLGEKKAQKYFSQVDRLINPNENNIVEYRPNGVVTKEGEVYTFHALSGMDTKAWRVAFKNDVSEQFKGNKAQEGKGKPAPVSQKIPQETKPFLETPEGEYTLDLMSQELQAGEAGLTMEEADSGLMNVTGRFSSHSPWAKDIMKKHKVDSKYLDNIIQKHLDGKELTEKQFKIFGDIRRAANKMNYNIPEGLPTKEEVAKSKENYAFTQKKIKDEGYQEAQSVEAYNLSKGDKVIKNGEEFKVIGEEEGNLILKDGETVKVPLDETLYVNAVKKTEPRSEGGGQSALQAKPIPEPRIENTKAGKQVTIPGASEAETFSLANPETEWSKPLPKQQTVKTETLFDATSILNPEEIVNQLRGLKNNIKEAIPHLEKLGRSVYESGKTKYFDWQKQIKSYLGDMWERFKPRIQEIWKTVIKTIKNEKGAIGKDINKGNIIKQREIGKKGEKRLAPPIYEADDIQLAKPEEPAIIVPVKAKQGTGNITAKENPTLEAELIEEAKKYDSAKEFINSRPMSKELRRQFIKQWKKDTDYKLVSSEIDRGDGIHSPADPESGAPLYDLTDNGIYPKDVYSFNGRQYYGTGEDKLDNLAYSIISELEAKPNSSLRIYRAVEKDGKGIQPGDWVTITRGYAKEHGEANINGEYKIVSKTVMARDLFTEGNSWLEWGYHPQKRIESNFLRNIYNKAHENPNPSRPSEGGGQLKDNPDIRYVLKSGAETEKLFDIVSESGVKYNHEIQNAEGKANIAEGQATQGEGSIPDTGGNVFPEIVSEKTGTYKASKSKIIYPDDLAELAYANIGNKAQENLIVVVTNKNGKILSVYRHTIGVINQAHVAPSIIVGQALNTPDAANIFVAHNHPSGKALLSPEDHGAASRIENLLDGTDVKLGDFIAVGKDKYDSRSGINNVTTGSLNKKIPVSERAIKQRGNQKSFKSAQDIISFAEENDVDGAILLNSQNEPVGTMKSSDFSKIRGDQQTYLLKDIERRNATGIAVIRRNGEISYNETRNIKSFSNAADIKLLDIIDKTGSYVNDRKMPTNNDVMFYSGIDITQTLDVLRGLTQNIKEAIPHLEKLGRSVYESGKTKYFDWQKQIKSYLGDMWERFKPRIQEIWKTVIKTIKIEKYFKNIKGILSNQRGSIGKGLTDDLKDILKDIGEVSDEYLGSISTRLGNIHPSIKNTMRKFEYTRGIKASERGKKVLPFLEKVKKMSKEDKEAFDLARKNGNPEELKRLVSKYNIGKEYHALKEVLSEMYNESVSVGYDVGYRFNYHPRVLKDSKGFLNYFYKHEKWPIINKAIKAKEAELKRLLTADEKAKLINSLLRGYPSNNIKLSRPGQLKERLVEVITPEVNEFYMDSDSALVHYINNVTDAIEAKRLFGGGEQTVKGFKPAIPIEDTIGGYVLKLLQEEKIMPDQEQVLTDILRARFNQVGTHGFVSAYKNLSYIDTMGSPISAVTQIGDLAWALYRNGFGKSLTSAGKAVFNKNKFTKEDLGVKRVASEFEDSTRTAKALEKVFKLTGLTKIDNIGKETLINSSYSKAVKLAKDNPEQLRKELKPVFEKETDQLVKDLQNGNVTDNVKLYLFNTLSDFQPISLSEMPQKYLSAGNGRIFYMLKTFTLKQFDVFRREAFQKIATPGTRLQGMKNLIWLTACFVFANATADEIKDLMLNRETEINDRVIDNLFRLGGVSKFVAWQARREGLRSAVVKQIAPPAKAPDAFLKDITQAGDGKGLELTQSIPIFGKFYYWWLGKGAEKTDKLDDLDGLNKLKE